MNELKARAEKVLNALLDHESTSRAMRYDTDRVKGSSSAGEPAGVRLDLLGMDKPCSESVSLYHHFLWRIEHARHDDFKMHCVVSLAEARLIQLQKPTVTPEKPLRVWERLVVDEGEGLAATQIAGFTPFDVAQVRAIRTENDLDPETGKPQPPPARAIDRARTMRAEGHKPHYIATVLGKSERQIRRYINDKAA